MTTAFERYYKAPLLTTLTHYTRYSSSKSAEAGMRHKHDMHMFILRPMPGGSWVEVWARSTPNIGLKPGEWAQMERGSPHDLPAGHAP